MGRLSGSPGPIRQTVPVPEPKHAKPEPKPPIKHPIKWCDQCGYSHDGTPISRATMQIEVPGGTLFMCNHHFNRHSYEFIRSEYSITEIYKVA